MAQAGVARDEARLALARQAFERLDLLRASVAFSQARLDDLEQETIAAMSEVDFARAAVQEALSLIDQNLARVERSRANLANAIHDLDDTAVRAPLHGVVTPPPTEAGPHPAVWATVLTLLNARAVAHAAVVPSRRLCPPCARRDAPGAGRTRAQTD